MSLHLAVDGGQSGMRARLVGDDLEEVTEHAGVLTDRTVLPQLARIVATALAGRRADTVALGVSGLAPDDGAAALHALIGDGVAEVLLTHDSITSYLGALGVREGAVVAAGTGAVTLAVGPREVRRVDGWGHLMGDLGSGFWIGREALTAVMRAFDGRGPDTALVGVAQVEFGDLTKAYLVLQADEQRVSRIAAWGRTVSDLAPTDEVCADISRRAGAHLAESVAAGLLATGASPVAACVGNVFRNPLVLESFSDHLTRAVPGAVVRAAAGTGLDGAARLREVADGSPLAGLIDRSRLHCQP